MLVLGLILIVAALAVGAAVVFDAKESTDLSTIGGSWHTTNAGVFVAGAATMLALLIGAWLLQRGLARARRRRLEVKGLKRDNKSLAQVEEEKAALAAELEQERARRARAGEPDTGRGVSPAGGNVGARAVEDPLTDKELRDGRR